MTNPNAHRDDAQDICFALTLSGPEAQSALRHRANKLAQYYLGLDWNDSDAWDVLMALRVGSVVALREAARRLSGRLVTSEGIARGY